MCSLVRFSVALMVAILLLSNPLSRVLADGSKEKDHEATAAATKGIRRRI